MSLVNLPVPTSSEMTLTKESQVTHSVSSYRPLNATEYIQSGSTSTIWKHPSYPGVVIKSPVNCEASTVRKFWTEMGVLTILGEHTRIVRYLGPLDTSKPRDILLEAATNGDLQQYLNIHGALISENQRLRWCKEVAEGLSYCHSKGVLHCDLRPDNLLLGDNLSLKICDFGGSVCGTLNGGGLPDYGFFDPREEDIFTVNESTEIFGLGSVMYTIMIGHRPHGPANFNSPDEQEAYGERFKQLVCNGIFPDTSDIVSGDIIQNCWTRKISSATEVLERLAS